MLCKVITSKIDVLAARRLTMEMLLDVIRVEAEKDNKILINGEKRRFDMVPY